MKYLYGFLLALVVSFFAFQSENASAAYSYDGVSYDHRISWTTNGNNYDVFIDNPSSNGEFYVTGSNSFNIKGKIRWKLVYNGSPNNGSDGFSATDTAYSIGDVTYTSTNIPHSNGGIFFTKPVRPVAELARVEQITEVVSQILRGGLLSTGLTVLAILLGVLLVPRLVRLFVR